jgi:hypothetical protein
MSTYKRGSDQWRFRATGGNSKSLGLSAGILSAQAGTKTIFFEGKRRYGGKTYYLQFRMDLTGMEFSAEISFDVISQFAKINISKIAYETDYVVPILNSKWEGTEPQSHEIAGACSLVSFDVGKAHGGVDIGAHKSKTYLFIGMHKAIVDKSADWLQKVVDNADSGTLGGNFIKFNKDNGPFSHALMVVPIQLSDKSAGLKFVGAGVAMYSGQITCTRVGV